MKKIFSLIVCLSILAMSSLALAGPYDRESGKPGHVKAYGTFTDVTAVAKPCEVYALTVYASTAAAVVSMYDKASTVTTAEKLALTGFKAENGEATQYETSRQVFDPPIQMENGVYLDVTNGYATVEYR